MKSLFKKGKWHAIKDLGGGGQGQVYLALSDDLLKETSDTIRRTNSVGVDPIVEVIPLIVSSLHIDPDTPLGCGALKVLHGVDAYHRDRQAFDRLVREIDAMRVARHPSLLTVIDADTREGWYVSPFYRNGTLAKHINLFAGWPDLESLVQVE